MLFLFTLLFSIFTTIALISILSRVAARVGLVDVPNERKVHLKPVPKAGGIAIAAGALASVIIFTNEEGFMKWYLVGGGIIILGGLIDDFRGLGPGAKFGAQIAGALMVIFPGMIVINDLGMLLPDGFLLPGWLAIPLTLVVIVGVTNAINLSDGLDGLAGGITLLSFCSIAYLAYLVKDTEVALLSLALIGGIFGFLRFNTHPASVFMGDAGSQFLGFSAIVLSLKVTQGAESLSPLLPLLILGFPVLDTLVVMAQRLQEKRPLFSADKNHLHHRLLRLGLFQTEAVLLVYIIQAGLVTSAYFLRFHSDWLLLAGYLVFSGAVVGSFAVMNKTGYRIERSHYFDRVIKGKLKELRDKGALIKVSFRVIEFGIPGVFLLTCFLPAQAPGYVPYAALILMGLIAGTWRFLNGRLGAVLRLSLYLVIPFILYDQHRETVSWMTGKLLRYYNLSFFLLAVFVVLTVKFTRRKKSFHSTPMDFLILFIALAIPNLPVEEIKGFQLGIMAAKIITLFYSYEVLMGELRGEFNKLALFTVISLGVVAGKGIL